MPLAPTTYMLLVRPTNLSDTDLWGTEMNALCALVDTHRHITGEGRPIPSAGIAIDADLSIGSKRLTAINGLAFNSIALLSAGSLELFVSSNNLYFRNAAGTNVRVTSGNALDMTTVGGIAGDYTSVGAEVAFTDGTDTYTFKQQLGAAVRQFAKMGSADLSLYEYKAQPAAGVPANAVTIKSPAALGAPYTLTLLAALPGSTQVMQLSSAGVMTASNTIANAVTLSALLTANAGVTLGANQNVTVSGTGDYKHGDRVEVYGASIGEVDDTAASWTFTPSVGGPATAWRAGGINDIVAFSIPGLKVGDRIKEVRAMVFDTAAANTVQMQLRRSRSDGTNTQIGATQTSSGLGAAQTLAITGLTSTIASGDYFTIVVQNVTATTTTNAVFGVEVTYDRP